MSTIVNPSVPYRGVIPGSLGIGSAITLNGTVKPHCQRFTIDLKCCNECRHNTDIAFHISARFDGTRTITRNTYLDDKWLEEENNLPLFPLTQGQIFGLIILNDASNFKIAINGHHMAEYTHRLPYQCVKAIEINGDVKISQISFQTMNVPNYSAVSFPKTDLTFIAPAYHPALPFTQLFHGGLKPSTVRIFGKPVYSEERFVLDFRADTVDRAATRPASDIAFHMSVRFDGGAVVVFNSLTNNAWQTEQRVDNVFRRGVNFDLMIKINHQCFQILVNGQFCGQFQNRTLPISRITSLKIEGGLVVSNVQFI